MAEGSRPPQLAMMASAGIGGFVGTILAITVIVILVDPCCCDYGADKRSALEESRVLTSNIVASEN